MKPCPRLSESFGTCPARGEKTDHTLSEARIGARGANEEDERRRSSARRGGQRGVTKLGTEARTHSVLLTSPVILSEMSQPNCAAILLEFDEVWKWRCCGDGDGRNERARARAETLSMHRSSG